MKKLFQRLIILSVGLFMSSCYNDTYPVYEEINDPNNGGGNGTEEVSYANDIAPLWGECLGCHNGNQPPNLQTNSLANLLNGYVVAGDANASKLYKSLTNDGVSLMPPGGWTQTKINLVKDWINLGAKNN